MTQQDWEIEWSERLCGVLLLLYPASFRERFGSEILAVFRQCSEERLHGRHQAGLVIFWLRTLKDFAFSIPQERAAQLSAYLDKKLSFQTQPDSIVALFAICLNVALWAHRQWPSAP